MDCYVVIMNILRMIVHQRVTCAVIIGAVQDGREDSHEINKT